MLTVCEGRINGLSPVLQINLLEPSLAGMSIHAHRVGGHDEISTYYG